MRKINVDEMRSHYTLNNDESVHKIYLRNFGLKQLNESLEVLDCFGGEGKLTKYWLDKGASVTALEKQKTRFGYLYNALKGQAQIINANSLKWIKEQNEIDQYNIFELDASGMANNWLKAILAHSLTGRKLFAVTDSGKLAFRTRAQLNPKLFDWDIDKPIVRNVGRELYQNYLHILREWWERLSKKHSFEIECWRYHECSHPKTSIYYIALLNFGQ